MDCLSCSSKKTPCMLFNIRGCVVSFSTSHTTFITVSCAFFCATSRCWWSLSVFIAIWIICEVIVWPETSLQRNIDLWRSLGSRKVSRWHSSVFVFCVISISISVLSYLVSSFLTFIVFLSRYSVSLTRWMSQLLSGYLLASSWCCFVWHPVSQGGQ